MPMYSYRCGQCGHVFEELVAMSKRDEVRCPECGEEAHRAWESSGTFGIGVSGGGSGCGMEDVCASGCGCGGQCRCGH